MPLEEALHKQSDRAAQGGAAKSDERQDQKAMFVDFVSSAKMTLLLGDSEKSRMDSFRDYLTGMAFELDFHFPDDHGRLRIPQRV